MEVIVNVSQFDKMIDNKIIGIPSLVNTNITFHGKNNILVFGDNVKLENVSLEFKGSNSIVFLFSDISNNFNLVVHNYSSVFIGRNTDIGENVKLWANESQNLIIGDDCLIEDFTRISTSDIVPIYDNNDKCRINFSQSIFIGDHVWLGQFCFISFGVQIGSGSIIGNNSFVGENSIIPSNSYLQGNPIKVVRKNVFFTKEYLGNLINQENYNSKYYKSNVFIFSQGNNETLSISRIDEILKELDIESKYEFIQKLFIQNKRRNRFSI